MEHKYWWMNMSKCCIIKSLLHTSMNVYFKKNQTYLLCHTQTWTVRITDACMSLCVCVRPCLCYAPFPVSCADSLKPKGLYWYWPSSHGSQRTLYINPASSILTVVLLWNVKIATLNLQNTLRQFHIHALIMRWSLIVSTWMFFFP